MFKKTLAMPTFAKEKIKRAPAFFVSDRTFLEGTLHPSTSKWHCLKAVYNAFYLGAWGSITFLGRNTACVTSTFVCDSGKVAEGTGVPCALVSWGYLTLFSEFRFSWKVRLSWFSFTTMWYEGSAVSCTHFLLCNWLGPSRAKTVRGKHISSSSGSLQESSRWLRRWWSYGKGVQLSCLGPSFSLLLMDEVCGTVEIVAG